MVNPVLDAKFDAMKSAEAVRDSFLQNLGDGSYVRGNVVLMQLSETDSQRMEYRRLTREYDAACAAYDAAYTMYETSKPASQWGE